MGGLVNHGMEFGFILWVSTGGSYFRKVVPTVLLRTDDGGARVEGGHLAHDGCASRGRC